MSANLNDYQGNRQTDEMLAAERNSLCFADI